MYTLYTHLWRFEGHLASRFARRFTAGHRGAAAAPAATAVLAPTGPASSTSSSSAVAASASRRSRRFGLSAYMLNTRNEEKNTVFYSYLACFVNTFSWNMYVSMSYTGFTRRNMVSNSCGEYVNIYSTRRAVVGAAPAVCCQGCRRRLRHCLPSNLPKGV